MSNINQNHLQIVYDNNVSLPCGFKFWVGMELSRLYTLEWKPEYNPYSSDEDSPTRIIGYIGFEDNSSKISYSYMKRTYRGKGLGEFMYLGVAKEEGSLATIVDSASESACKLWTKLVNKYPHRKSYNNGGGEIYRIYP